MTFVGIFLTLALAGCIGAGAAGEPHRRRRGLRAARRDGRRGQVVRPRGRQRHAGGADRHRRRPAAPARAPGQTSTRQIDSLAGGRSQGDAGGRAVRGDAAGRGVGSRHDGATDRAPRLPGHERPRAAGLGRPRRVAPAHLRQALRALGAPAVGDAGPRLLPRPRGLARALRRRGALPAHVRPVGVLRRRAARGRGARADDARGARRGHAAVPVHADRRRGPPRGVLRPLLLRGRRARVRGPRGPAGRDLRSTSTPSSASSSTSCCAGASTGSPSSPRTSRRSSRP